MNFLKHINFDDYVMISVISALISMLLLVGILLLLRGQIRQLTSVIKASKRLPKLRRASSAVTPNRLIGSLSFMLRSVMKNPISPTAFLAIEIVIFFIVFTASASNLSIRLSMAIAMSFCAIPWLFLRLKLERIRRKGSFEGETLVSALLTQYWVSGTNIFDTIEKVVETSKGISISTKLLSSFLITLRSTGSRIRIKEAADAFAYGIGTNWGRMLAWNIQNAAITGCDIGLALEDILIQLREARALHEERKRINNESAKLSFYLVPLIYAGSVVVCLGMLGMSPAKFMKNQFMTAEGFVLFSFTIFLFLLNIVLVETVTNRKLDF